MNELMGEGEDRMDRGKLVGNKRMVRGMRECRDWWMDRKGTQ